MRHCFAVWALALGLALGGCASDESTDQETIHLDTTPEQTNPEQTTPEETTTGGGDDLVLSEDACETDEDCVPAGCCHAAACVGTANAPSCGDVMCTQECRYGTLDCGGRCLCHEGRCAARLSETPNFE
ncbi:MAG: hypothetical protein H6721_09280 [Sandaracinus sp.]|nr:hypothetical protein [Sandaracinus sp.]